MNTTNCKTKCITFLFKERLLESAVLCGDPLPLVQGGEHLGNHISNSSSGMKQDICVKIANFINKNIDLKQNFYFSHHLMKVKINFIHSFHFTGSPLWELFLEGGYHVGKHLEHSCPCHVQPPLDTHRYLIEQISQAKHLKVVLIDMFLNFLIQIKKFKKQIPKQLLQFIKDNVRSTTGSNLHLSK